MKGQIARVALLIGLFVFVFSVLVGATVRAVKVQPKSENSVERFWTDGTDEYNDFSFNGTGAFIRVRE